MTDIIFLFCTLPIVVFCNKTLSFRSWLCFCLRAMKATELTAFTGTVTENSFIRGVRQIRHLSCLKTEDGPTAKTLCFTKKIRQWPKSKQEGYVIESCTMVRALWK